MAKFRCIVATPERELFAGEVDHASVPAADGYFGVLSGFENYAGLNGDGLVTLTIGESGNDKRQFLITGGVTEQFGDFLTILPRFGCTIDEIDEAAVREQIAEAEAEIEKLRAEYDETDDALVGTQEAMIAWFNLQLKAKNGELHK